MEEEKRGRGRPKGSKNKRSQILGERAEQRGVHPDDFLFDVMAGKHDVLKPLTDFQKGKLRVEAAKILMPYLFPKLSSTEVDLKGNLGPMSITIVADERP